MGDSLNMQFVNMNPDDFTRIRILSVKNLDPEPNPTSRKSDTDPTNITIKQSTYYFPLTI